MIKLTLYGKPSYSYEYIKNSISREAKLAGVEIEFNEIMDTHKFIEDNITSIPAIKIGEEVRSQGTEDIKSFSKSVCNWILTKENYGLMNKIIIPTDFSDCSKNAAKYGIALSKFNGAVVDLLHIYHPGPSAINGEVIIDPLSREIKEEKLNKYAQKLKDELLEDQKNVYLNHRVIQGFAADEIIEQSATLDNSMIVMGSTGNSHIQKKLFGSVSIKVSKLSKRPVLIIPNDVSFKKWDNILYCSNDLSLDSSVFNKLVDFAKLFDSNIHLVHANTEEDSNYNELNLIKLYQNFYPREKIVFNQLNCEDPILAIQKYSEENNIDLVTSATKERGFLNDIFHKSFTKELAMSASLPLLILHK